VCRALGAEIIIAANVSQEMFGHGTVVQSLSLDGMEAASPIEAGERSLFRRLLGGSDDKPGLSGVMMESFNIIQDRITRSRLAGDPPDVMIAPRLGHIGLFDFHRAREAIDIGASATDRAISDITTLIAELTR
jgi:NTE family protein